MPQAEDRHDPATNAAHTDHVSEHLANERTFLAWVRTSIAIIGLGFVMAKFSVWLRQFLGTVAPRATLPPAGASLPAGIALIALGAVTTLISYARYLRVARAIDAGTYTAQRGLLVLVTLSLVVVSVAVIVYLVASAPSLTSG